MPRFGIEVSFSSIEKKSKFRGNQWTIKKADAGNTLPFPTIDDHSVRCQFPLILKYRQTIQPQQVCLYRLTSHFIFAK